MQRVEGEERRRAGTTMKRETGGSSGHGNALNPLDESGLVMQDEWDRIGANDSTISGMDLDARQKIAVSATMATAVPVVVQLFSDEFPSFLREWQRESPEIKHKFITKMRNQLTTLNTPPSSLSHPPSFSVGFFYFLPLSLFLFLSFPFSFAYSPFPLHSLLLSFHFHFPFRFSLQFPPFPHFFFHSFLLYSSFPPLTSLSFAFQSSIFLITSSFLFFPHVLPLLSIPLPCSIHFLPSKNLCSLSSLLCHCAFSLSPFLSYITAISTHNPSLSIFSYRSS